MPLKPEERKVIIDDLVTNCDCWKHQGDRELLNSFTDEKLAAIKVDVDKQRQAIKVANAAVGGFTDGATAYRVNPETGNWERGTVPQHTNQPTPAPHPTPTPVHNTPAPAPTPAPPERRKPQTTEEWLREAPPEIQNRFNYLGGIEHREKEKIVAQMLNNVAECDRRAQYDRLMRYPLEELHNLSSLMPKPITVEEQPKQPARQQRRQDADEDMLLMPTMNWTEMGNQTVTQPTTNGGGNNSQSISEPTEDEWLRTAPAHIRNQLQEASAVLERERRKLINELTSNVTDEDAQTRLTQRLQNKSVEELRDLLVLQPRRDTGRATSFFGTSTPPVLNRGSDPSEDILPLPKIDWTEARKQA